MSNEFDGVVWPGWEVVRLIGRGSSGAVYEIQRDVFGHKETAALKVIKLPQNGSDIEDLYNDGYDEASVTARFEGYLKDIVQEYSFMSEMKGHTNIVYCDDLRYVQHDDRVGWDIYIKMEYLTPLPQALKAGIKEEDCIRVGMDICSALSLCKSRNIIHRDIKPQNIFVSQDGNYKLGDFGIAKTTERTTMGAKVGTYKYMAPEVYNNQPYGRSSDIYSLGLVMYWMLNERRTPFLPMPPQVPTGSQEDAARTRRFEGEPLPAPKNGSEALKAIVLKACAHDTKARYHDPEDMRADLEALLKGTAVPVGVPIAPPAEGGEEGKGGTVTEGAPVPPPMPPKPKAPKEPKEPEKKPDEPVVLEKEKKKKKSPWGWIGAAAAVILILLLLPRACAGGLGVPASSTASNTTAAPAKAKATTAPTKAPALQKDWTEWLDELPRGVSEDEYEIEETTMYSYRTKETSSSTTSKHMEGWKYEGTAAAGKDYGAWSDWSTGGVSASGNREVESRNQYRYQDMEYASSSSSSKSGWELYDTTYTQGDYGSWSDWTTTRLSSSSNTQVETTTQYRYQYIEYTNSYSSSASGWNYYSGPHYNSWGSSQTTTSKPTESDTLRITNTKQTKWGYYHVCCNYYDGGYNVDSIAYGSGSHQKHYTTSGWAFPACKVGDKGGKQAYGGTGSGCGGCSAGFYVWFRNTGADVYEYTYQTRSAYYTLYRWGAWSSWGSSYPSDADDVETRTLYRSRTRQSIPTYHFRRWGNWTDWSDAAVSASSTRNVESRTLYRYRDVVEKQTYLFSRWTEWSEYTQAPVEEDQYTEVVTKTMYRYRSKNND